jgi:hypothetical protein
MRTTIFDAFVSTESNGALSLRERWSAEVFAFRAVSGLFTVGVGTLVAYVFLSGGGPRPMGGIGQQIFGWAVIALFFTALGVVPIYCGLATWFMRRRHFINVGDRELRSSVTFAALPVWHRLHPLSAFERVLIWHVDSGVFGRRRYWIVSCDGPSRHVDLAEFEEYAAAEKLADEVARRVGLPVVSSC